MNDSILRVIKTRLLNAERILLVSHIRPDGDAVGSLLGFGLALEASGKTVQMVLADGVPGQFRHLSGSERVLSQPNGDFDFVCVLDCSDLQRVGSVLDNTRLPDLNVDHHLTNINFAQINLVDLQAVATAEIITELVFNLNFPITQAWVDALLTGIITDTLGFRTSNMTPKALRLAADLMDLGGNLPNLYRQTLLVHSFEALRYWGVGLIQLRRQGRIIWTTLSLSDRKSVGYSGRDDADLINVLSSIDQADIAIIFVEQSNMHVKVSWRAQPGTDVSQIALQFGGGGHSAASGADIPGRLDDVCALVLQATQASLLEKTMA